MNCARLAVCCGLFVLLIDTAGAHGGQYRGPEDIVPPPAGGVGPGGRAGGPGGPTEPGAGPIPRTGTPPVRTGVGSPGAGVLPAPVVRTDTPTTGPGGIPITTDLTRWTHWWEFNKDRFIRLKDAIHSRGVVSGGEIFYMGPGKRRDGVSTLKPTERQIVGEILPALKEMLARTDNRDIVGAVMVAMGKIGRDHPDFEILPIMAERLTSGDQETRETAALAMGISQMTKGVDTYLSGLASDDARGRRLVSRGEVDYRTRSFAAYGLGLVAWATSDVDLKRKCFAVLASVLQDESIASRDVRVAAINGLSLLAPNPNAADGKERQLLEGSLDVLREYFLRPMGAGEELIQAHVPTAIAKLLTRDGPEEHVQPYKELFLEELRGKGRGNNIQRSAALALGMLARPSEVAYSKALLDHFQGGRDQQARYFSLIALGQIGGIDNRDQLLREFVRGNKGLEKPWGALALGVYAHNSYERAERGGRDPEVDHLVGRTLHRALVENRNPDVVAALAIGLGLAKYTDAVDDLRDLLVDHRQQDELAGYLCIGLALMGEPGSREDIADVVRRSVRRPELLRQAAVALGKLGDKNATVLLGDMLKDGGQNLARLSAIASALGFIGDAGTITPLKEIMFDQSLTPLSRAFAAVALGGVADKEPLPWNAKIGSNLNYRAAVETLFDGAGGILDIL